MRDMSDVYVVNDGHGEGITGADLAELQRRREDPAAMADVGPVAHHVGARRQCFRCGGRVFTYATTADGTRHYCGVCVRRVRADIVCGLAAGCGLAGGHPGRCRDAAGATLRVPAGGAR